MCKELSLGYKLGRQRQGTEVLEAYSLLELCRTTGGSI